MPTSKDKTSLTRRSVPLQDDDDDDDRHGDGGARPSKMARLDGDDDVAATLTFESGGKSYCSRAVQSSTDADDKVAKSGPLTRLPSALLAAIFEEAADAPSLEHLNGGPLGTAFPNDAAAKTFERQATMAASRLCPC